MRKWLVPLTVCMIAGVATVLAMQPAKKSNWPRPKCSAAEATQLDGVCPRAPGATVTGIVAVDAREVVLVAPDPLVVCGGDKVIWVLTNACDEKNCQKKKIRIQGPEKMANVFQNCQLKDNELDPGTVASVSCDVVQRPKLGIFKYNVSGSHECDPEVDVREGGTTTTSVTTSTTTTTLPNP